jgi:uncharacterized protein YdhG (YjbR/CyaY superfamily)
VRSTIKKALPGAEEGISYQLPVFKLNGKAAVYFAGWKEHFSLYPAGVPIAEAFKAELANYEVSKGTVRFPLSEPAPLELIERIAKFRASQLATRDTGKNRKKGPEAQLARIRRICAAMPSVWEKLSHGAPTFFVGKDKGVFTMFVDNHHDDGHLAVWLPVAPGMQSALIGDAPKTYFKPPYFGANGWVGIELDQINDEALEIHIREAWSLIAPQKKSAARIRQRQ